MNIVTVFTSKPLETMMKEGGSGYWSANKKRLEKCTFLVATKSNTLREHFPSNVDIKQGSAFLIGKISNIEVTSDGKRLLIQFSEYAELNIPKVWEGNRNPVAYTDLASFEQKHSLDTSKLDWEKFPTDKIKIENNVKSLTVDEAKNGIAKTLGIDPKCIEIQIKA